jgi:hypothetical protein
MRLTTAQKQLMGPENPMEKKYMQKTIPLPYARLTLPPASKRDHSMQKARPAGIMNENAIN